MSFFCSLWVFVLTVTVKTSWTQLILSKLNKIGKKVLWTFRLSSWRLTLTLSSSYKQSSNEAAAASTACHCDLLFGLSSGAPPPHTHNTHQDVKGNVHAPAASLLVQTFCFIWTQSASYLRLKGSSATLHSKCNAPRGSIRFSHYQPYLFALPSQLHMAYSAASHPLSALADKSFLYPAYLAEDKTHSEAEWKWDVATNRIFKCRGVSSFPVMTPYIEREMLGLKGNGVCVCVCERWSNGVMQQHHLSGKKSE